MKLFLLVILALVIQGFASSSYESSEEDNEYLRPYSSHWDCSACSLHGAKAFKSKVTKRIRNSDVLSDLPQVQKKLFDMANEKLEECKKPHAHELDKHCVGRITGKMMQMIAHAENNSNSRYGYNRDY
ncbi:uncharacterized protein ACRADG_009137 [Cochliomyia hominivorax]